MEKEVRLCLSLARRSERLAVLTIRGFLGDFLVPYRMFLRRVTVFGEA